MRRALQEKINTACMAVQLTNYGTLINGISDDDSAAGDSTDSEILCRFLTTLSLCCFLPNHQLPVQGLKKGGRALNLQSWHTRWFAHVLREPEKVPLGRHRARVIKVFQEINNAIVCTSWYNTSYTINWDAIKQALYSCASSIEADCYVLVSDDIGSSTSTGNSKLSDSTALLKWLDYTAVELMEMWSRRNTHPRRRGRWVGIVSD